MKEIGDRIYRLGSSYHNFYVIEEAGKVTVIDAGGSKEWSKLVDGLAEIGLAPVDVEAVIATHAHADHIGFGRTATEAGLDVRVHEAEEERALGRYQGKSAVGLTDLPLLRIATWRFLLTLMKAGVMKQPPLEAVTTVVDGERLDLPGSPTVVHTPGHTEGHVVFHVPSRSTVFTGDALATRDLLGPATVRPQMMPDIFHNDPALAHRSLERIAALDASLVLPGHGDPYNGSAAAAVAAAR